ncbi:MAG: T9SS type A sorting domain-containing protein, partial [Bacteroidota bacterium]|nr:T9SS type A sorting domain-containing protein [Bacteroidota bacterium]
RQQRQKLEPQLAAADRTLLATYRTQLHALKQQGRALRQAVAPAAGTMPGTHPVLTEAQREQAHQLRLQARSIMLNVAQMAQKYDGAISQLAQEIQPQKEKWSTDIKAIVVKNATPEQQAKLAAAGSRRPGFGPLRRLFKPVMFLLLDPNAPAEAPTGPGIGSTSFYPNPAAATTQLEYDVKKAGPVSVDLLDKDGNKLRTLLPETLQDKGSQHQQLDLSDLPAGTYFYRIATRQGTQTKRFLKE